MKTNRKSISCINLNLLNEYLKSNNLSKIYILNAAKISKRTLKIIMNGDRNGELTYDEINKFVVNLKIPPEIGAKIFFTH